MADLPRAAKVNLAKLPLLLSDRSQFSFNSLSDQTTALKFKHKRKNFALAHLTEPLLILVEPSKPSDQAQVRSTICPVLTLKLPPECCTTAPRKLRQSDE
jgi:hypothetical protein